MSLFFVNLQVGISQLHYRLTSSHINFRNFKQITPSNSYFLFLCKMVQKLLRLKSATCTLNITSFTEMLYKTGDLNNFSKITDKHKKQTSGSVLLKDNLNNFTKLTEKHLRRSLLFNKVAGWKPKNVRSSHSRCFVKKVFLKRLVFQKRLFIDPLQNRCS